MVGANFMDEMDCGIIFDHIDDFLEFPKDDLDTDLLGAIGDCGSSPGILPGRSSNAMLGSDSVLPGNTAPNLSAQLSVPYEDIVQLEWLSNFVEDSFSGKGMTNEKTNVTSTIDSSQSQQYQTSSPVSVLESSSSSCSRNKTFPVSHEKRARTKRPRPPTFNPRPPIQLVSPTSSLTESQSPKKLPKKIKIVPPSNPAHSKQNQNPTVQPLRKCMHCEITKTPQWRAGPVGPKTLCNACGVRYKSGRLFPEYRPAASPTFIPAIHSNSHKKVIEMRTNMGDKKADMNIEDPPTNATRIPARCSLIPKTEVRAKFGM